MTDQSDSESGDYSILVDYVATTIKALHITAGRMREAGRYALAVEAESLIELCSSVLALDLDDPDSFEKAGAIADEFQPRLDTLRKKSGL